MKIPVHFHVSALCITALVWSAPQVVATDLTINAFDTPNETNHWWNWWGLPSPFTWDGTMDALGHTNSGSLAIPNAFTNSTSYQECVVGRDLVTPINGTSYTSVSFDVKVNPSSSLTSAGSDYGDLTVFLADSNWVNCTLGAITLYSSVYNTNWQHIEIPLEYGTGTNTTIRALGFQISSSSYTGPVALWLDNVKLVAFPNPPALVIQPSTPGVELCASVPAYNSNGFFQYQSIRTITGGYSWLGRPQPVNYSITISDFPASDQYPFTATLTLVGNSANPGAVPDWNEANVIGLYLQYWGTNLGMQVRYKLNAPNSSIWANPMVLGYTSSGHVRGAFGLSLQGSNISILWPNGGSAMAQFPDPNVVNCFNSSTHLYVTIGTGGSYNNIGQSATVSRVQVIGLASAFDDTFSNLNNWTTGLAQDPSGIVLHPATTVAKLTWPVLPTGFILHQSPDLSPNSWVSSSLPSVTVYGCQVGFPTANPPGGKTFYRLEKP